MLEVKLMAGALGAEIHGIDLRQPITATIAKEIRQLWLKYQVIFFRNQNINPTALLMGVRNVHEINCIVILRTFLIKLW